MMIRTCVICDVEFEVIRKHGGHNRTICYSCLPEGLSSKEQGYATNALYRIRANRNKVELGCSKCGYNKHPAALEWHHNRGDKKDNISTSIYASWARYSKEIAKCILLCSNCHREEHFTV